MVPTAKSMSDEINNWIAIALILIFVFCAALAYFWANHEEEIREARAVVYFNADQWNGKREVIK